MFDIIKKITGKDERSLSDLKSRLIMLQKDLVTAQADEKSAEEMQRQVYRNSQDRTACDNADDALVRSGVRIKGLTTAIIESKNEIADIEKRNAEAEAKSKRDEAANRLSFTVENFAITMANLERSVTDSLAAMKVVIDGLPGFVPGVNTAVIHPNIANMFNGALSGMKNVVELGRTHVDQVRTGVSAISAPPPPPEPVKKAEPPAPDVERRSVYLFQHSWWTEPDGTVKTAPQYGVVSLPAAIAAKAIALNLCDDTGSLRSVNVRSAHGIDHGPARPIAECTCLEDGKPPSSEQAGKLSGIISKSVEAEQPTPWVERTGQVREGTARSVPRY
jgi:hypothetical protein